MAKTVVVSGASRGIGFCLARQHLQAAMVMRLQKKRGKR